MATYDRGRTDRLAAVRKAHPTLTADDIAACTGKARKTVYMWIKGKPGSIPEHSLLLLEKLYPPKPVFPLGLTRDERDLLG